MIGRWSVSNFKAIGQADVELSAINVILGMNSVGKSSFVQSILAVTEYFQVSTFPSNRMNFVGNAQDLGPAYLVRNRNSSDNSMSFGFTYSKSELSFNVDATLVGVLKTAKAGDLSIEEFVVVPEALKGKRGGSLYCKLAMKNGVATRSYTFEIGRVGDHLSLGWTQASDARDLTAPMRNFADENDKTSCPRWLTLMQEILPGRPGIQTRAGYLGAPPHRRIEVLTDFLSGVAACSTSKSPIKSAFDSVPPNLRRRRRRDMTIALDHLRAVLANGLESEKSDLDLIWVALTYLIAQGKIGVGREFPEFAELFEQTEATHVLVSELLFSSNLTNIALGLAYSVKYLGPIRTSHPKQQLNGRSTSAITPLGSQGEYLASVLHRYGNVKRRFCLPYNHLLPENSLPEETTLVQALNAWLGYFDLGAKAQTGQTWLAADFQIDGERTNQKGTGVSQIVPVLVNALLAKRGETVIFEQPELHLHPAHQRKLADCLAEFARTGVQVIVETHSEYFVTRLRLLTATKVLNPADVKFIFAESARGKSSDGVVFKEANLNLVGRPDYWPDGFFEDSLEDRLLLSSIQFADEMGED